MEKTNSGGNARPIAIGARLKQFPEINTLGLRPNFKDYSIQEQEQILAAPKIYYPTLFYADLFNVMGKPTFPSYHTYKFALDKIKQTTMFFILNLPHPRTRFFYGRNPRDEILTYFSFPFIGKQATGSSRGRHIFLIENEEDLKTYLHTPGPAYIQEYLPIKKDIRIVVIGDKIRLAYWRKAEAGSFKTNLDQGGSISFDYIPQNAKDLALSAARKCGWDDIGLDIIEHDNRFYILEANVKYGTKGFQKANIDYKKMVLNLILNHEI